MERLAEARERTQGSQRQYYNIQYDRSLNRLENLYEQGLWQQQQ